MALRNDINMINTSLAAKVERSPHRWMSVVKLDGIGGASPRPPALSILTPV
ncbi:hypothetical protein E4U53_000966 [Claviceps sorghi]|nr:hypothetical protein E4U53_000966 [Claviceps sorghi]